MIMASKGKDRSKIMTWTRRWIEIKIGFIQGLEQILATWSLQWPGKWDQVKKVKDLACLRTMFDRTESEIRTPKLAPLNPTLPQSLNPTLTHPEPPK